MDFRTTICRFVVASVILASGRAVTAQTLAQTSGNLFQQVLQIDHGTSGVDLRTAFANGTDSGLSLSLALEHAYAGEPLPSMSGGIILRSGEEGRRLRAGRLSAVDGVENGWTVGKRTVILNARYSSQPYDRLQGVDLAGDGARTYHHHVDCCSPSTTAIPSPAFEGDALEVIGTFRLRSNTLNIAATYGLSRRLDIGVVVPVRQVTGEVAFQGRILRLATAATPGIHRYDITNAAEKTVSGKTDATGIGDVVLRAKFALFQRDGTALAAGGDLRTRTGDRLKGLTSGASQARVYGGFSSDYGRLAVHANAGYTLPILRAAISRRIVNLSSSADYGAATDVRVFGLVAGAGVFGRYAWKGIDYGTMSSEFVFRPGSETAPPQSTTLGNSPVVRFDPATGIALTRSLNIARMTAGIRWPVTDRHAVVLNVARFLTDNGMTTKGLSLTVGLHAGF